MFRDRRDAGRKLSRRLGAYAGRPDLLVLALPRGGVPVAFEVARTLGAPLDVFVVRKLGVPDREELAMGAIATGGVRVLNEEVVSGLRIPVPLIEESAAREQRELERRERAYHAGRPPRQPSGKTVILVDDGLATGATMKAAVAALRRLFPRRIVVAVPVGSVDAYREIGEVADEVVCVATPEPFHAVGVWYERFSQTTDDEVVDLLELSEKEHPHGTDRQDR